MPTMNAQTTRGMLTVLQRRRKLVIAAAVVLTFLALPMLKSLPTYNILTHELVEIAGVFLIAVAILGRAWCTLYIGGRKAQELTATGPYSISRNPLYVFSFIGAAGVGAQTGSVVISLIFALGCFAIFLPVILREEHALAEIFGGRFDAYTSRVPRFGPRFSSWQDMETIEVRPKLLWRTLRDGSVFLMVIPLFELIDWLQKVGYVKPLLHVP